MCTFTLKDRKKNTELRKLLSEPDSLIYPERIDQGDSELDMLNVQMIVIGRLDLGDTSKKSLV